MRGSIRTARARAMRCRWPPERLSPRSPTLVSYPSGSSRTKPSAQATDAAASTSARLAPGPAVGDVGGDRVGEQEALPERRADLAAERAQRHVADVVPVDQDLTSVRVEQPLDQADHGRLPAAAGADESDPLAGGHAEVEPAQHLLVVVPEVDVTQLDVAPQLGELDGVRWVRDRGLEVEHLEDPLHAGAGLLADRQDARELAGRGDELGDVRRERQEGAQRDVPLHHQPAAECEHGDLGERRDRLQQRLVAGLQAGRPHPAAVQALDDADHPVELALLLAEGLHHPHAADVLVDDLGDLALALLSVPARREHLHPEAVGDHEERGCDDEPDAGQERREPEHDGQGHQHQQDVAEHQGQEVEQPQDQRGVAAGPGDELSGGELGQGALVEGEQVVVELVAQVVLDGQRRLAVVVATQVRQAEDRERDHHEQRQPRPEGLGGVADHVVDDGTGDQRHHRLARAAQDGRGERDLDVALVLPDLAAQPADPPPRGVLAG